VNIKNGDISLPNYSSQTISSAGTTWADVGGTSATGGTRANGTTVSKVEINSAAGGKRADNTTQNTIAAGGFGNTVQMSTTFDMTVFGK
jgi:hypothetical protein